MLIVEYLIICRSATIVYMTKLSQKNKVITLRRKGYSYSLIQEKLGVPLGTLSYWLKDVPFAPNSASRRRINEGRQKTNAARTYAKENSIRESRAKAFKDIGKLSRRDIFMVGIGLYIGEGAKTICTGVINSDPRVIVFAIRWFKEVCGLENKHFVINIHVYPDIDADTCLAFWSSITGIRLEQFGKTQVDNRQGKKMAKRGKLRYGTAHLRVKSLGEKKFGVFLQRRIAAWMERVLSDT